MRNKRFFLCSDTLSTINLIVPKTRGLFTQYDEYEVTMRDCSRQIHWMFPVSRSGLAKAKKVAKFFSELEEDIANKLASKSKYK